MAHPDRIYANVNGASTEVFSGRRGLVGCWHEHGADRPHARAYLREDGPTLAEVRDCFAACIAMIQHAIGPGRDVFIEPDVRRKLSDARAALAKLRGE